MNAGSVVNRVFGRIPDIPSALSGASTGALFDFVAETANDVGLFTNETIDTTNIATKYQTILINLTCALTLGHMMGVGVDFDYSLGGFSVRKGSQDKQSNQVNLYLSMANDALHRLGRQITWSKTNG